MLISRGVFWLIVLVAGGTAFAAIAAMPALARSGGTRRQQVLSGVVGALGLVAALTVYLTRRNVIVCIQHGQTIETRRKVAIFGTGAGATWVVNQTSRPLQIVEIRYGISFGFGPDRTPVPPGQSLAYHEAIDFIGPDNPPPSAIRSEVAIDSRSWLTWDDGLDRERRLRVEDPPP